MERSDNIFGKKHNETFVMDFRFNEYDGKHHVLDCVDQLDSA